MRRLQKIFAIRDDDTSFFTNPDDLDAVYGALWGKLPISLAIVPFAVPVHRGHSFNNSYPAGCEMALGENQNLVDYLKQKISAGQVEVMLHGYSHRYSKINGRWIGEYGWKPANQLMEETLRGKKYLEHLLETKIKVFVPPSNAIGKTGVDALRVAGLHLSGIMGYGGDRPFTWDYLAAYAKRWTWRLIHGDAYPFPLTYGGHTELRAYALTPRADVDQLKRSLKRCAKLCAPFVLATHYWEFGHYPVMRETLSELIAIAESLGFSFKFVSDCFME